MGNFETGDMMPHYDYEEPREHDYTIRPLSPDEIWATLSSPALDAAWNDPATRDGAAQAFARVEVELAARGDFLDDPFTHG